MVGKETLKEQLSRVATEIGLPPGDSPYEIRMSQILNGLVDNGKILSFERTLKRLRDDMHGIDFWVTFPEGKRVPFQVTGSRKKVRQKIRNHPGIPVIYFAVRGEDEKYHDRRPEKIEELVMRMGKEYEEENY